MHGPLLIGGGVALRRRVAASNFGPGLDALGALEVFEPVQRLSRKEREEARDDYAVLMDRIGEELDKEREEEEYDDDDDEDDDDDDDDEEEKDQQEKEKEKETVPKEKGSVRLAAAAQKMIERNNAMMASMQTRPWPMTMLESAVKVVVVGAGAGFALFQLLREGLVLHANVSLGCGLC